MSVGDIAVRYGCRVAGDPDVVVDHVATLQSAGPGAITFLANPRYRRWLADTGASAVILEAGDAGECPTTALISDNPYALYARVATELSPPRTLVPGIDAGASVADSAAVPADCEIGPQAVIEADVVLGKRVYVGPGVVIGHGARIGDDTRLLANVTVCHGVDIGQRVIIHPGSVIGADGFGIARETDGWFKVPQLGSVTIGNDVEIGSCTSIDRGAIEDTVIEDGVKLDNQIQVAHNVYIGAHTVVAACSGISGSTRIGKRCMIAGAVGFVGHLEIADDVIITGQTMVNRSINEPGGVYSSALPMDEARQWRRNSARFRRLDDMAKRLRQLEKKISELSDD
ncbi:MAG: UDP-3-O-(3-hydroxymyristoyl)glucosamine N-acyltransferase [Gammaproteobacteria bacterium]|nr:UDP-3-O-(3-hydroxymyristoyl)glucosamine N-acyltransferase [Gammaproteobacteria bacterium]